MKLLYNFNSRRTKKKFTHKIGDMFCTGAAPDDFLKESALLNYNLFEMVCLQGYVQLDNGKWEKSTLISFETYSDMMDAGIEVL